MSRSGRELLDPELRDRAILPVLIPVSAIVVTEIVIFSLSRILLASDKTQAVVIALGSAVAILLGSALIASRPRLRTASIIRLLVLVGVLVVAAGVIAAQRGPAYEKEGGHQGKAVRVIADHLVFNTKTIKLPAGKASIELDNKDTQPHNIAVFRNSKSLQKALFRGAILQPGAKATYEVRLEAGKYFFHCEVHPTMTGTVVVA